ncbi:MAG: helix-turn-helix domain-containing protein [Candidatus Hydrogenedentes bacterium]|nr:helix-turn-helix domain-containing protein [Candidatus Hydrogenedentota bacterium]
MPDIQTETKSDYSISDLVKILGVCDRTVRELVRRGALPGIYRVMGQWRIRREAFDAWRESGGSK